MNPSAADQLAGAIAGAFRKHLLAEGMPRIRDCVQRLTEAQVWSRPNAATNAIGNLLLHLEGNVRQWILVGLGGAESRRDRPAEFAARGDDPALAKDHLVDRLETTVQRAVAVVEAATPAELLAIHPFQDGRYAASGAAGVLHVMEHFSGHAYQIFDRTKQLTAQDLQFYDL